MTCRVERFPGTRAAHRAGVRVAAVESVNIPVSELRIDSVLRLERDGLVWYRHVEFQAQQDADMPRRCFEYNSEADDELRRRIETQEQRGA